MNNFHQVKFDIYSNIFISFQTRIITIQYYVGSGMQGMEMLGNLLSGFSIKDTLQYRDNKIKWYRCGQTGHRKRREERIRVPNNIIKIADFFFIFAKWLKKTKSEKNHVLIITIVISNTLYTLNYTKK